MNEYAVEFELIVDREVKTPFSPYITDVRSFSSENFELWDMVDFDADFYFEDPRFDALTTGVYIVYARGQAEFESDVDWESGIEEGHFLLGIDTLAIKQLQDGIEDEDDSGLSM